jgi:hypothetical protein
VIDVEKLSAAVVARLGAGNGPGDRLDVFDGEVKAVMDTDGGAHPYAAFYAAPGNLSGSTLCETPDELLWSFQVTAAGGDPARARRAVARVRRQLTGHLLLVEGDLAGLIRETPGYDAGPVRKDETVKPARWFSPLLFQVWTTG